MFELSDVLWRIRERVETDIELPGLARDKIMATVVRLLETTLIRIGSDEYAKANKAFGLTTMRRRHATVVGSELRFEFRGKSRIQHAVAVTDKRIARIVQRLQELRGEECSSTSTMRESARRSRPRTQRVPPERHWQGHHAKDFRTWGEPSRREARAKWDPPETKREAERTLSPRSTSRQNVWATPAAFAELLLHPRSSKRISKAQSSRRCQTESGASARRLTVRHFVSTSWTFSPFSKRG